MIPKALMLPMLVVFVPVVAGFAVLVVWLLHWWGVAILAIAAFVGFNIERFGGDRLTQAARNPFFRGADEAPGETPTWAAADYARPGADLPAAKPARHKMRVWIINLILVAIAIAALAIASN